MAPLQNCAIERSEVLFELEVVIFGRLVTSASRLPVNVLAQTERGARRLCLLHYRRSEVSQARKYGLTLDMAPHLTQATKIEGFSRPARPRLQVEHP